MQTPDFLNVDLNIESTSDLTLLQNELGRKVYAMTDGPVSPGCFLLRLETARQFKTPDATICAFCSLLERLSPKAKRLWRAAHKKEFDIGHDIVRRQIHSQFSLSNDTLKRLSDLGATLGITFYNLPQASLKPSSKPSSARRRKKTAKRRILPKNSMNTPLRPRNLCARISESVKIREISGWIPLSPFPS